MTCPPASSRRAARRPGALITGIAASALLDATLAAAQG
jgi:hypothetical protein